MTIFMHHHLQMLIYFELMIFSDNSVQYGQKTSSVVSIDSNEEHSGITLITSENISRYVSLYLMFH